MPRKPIKPLKLMLLTGIDDLKKYLGRAVNRASEDSEDHLFAFVRLAQDEFLRPALGQEILTELATQQTANSLTTANRVLIELVKQTLAWYGYYKYLDFSIGNDGENGLQEQSTDKTQPVRIGVLDKRQRASILNATHALESVLSLLYLTPTNYPAFKASAAYTEARSLVVLPTQLGTYLPHTAGSYRLFLALKPYLIRAERDELLPVLGEAQYTDFKAKYLANTLSEDEQSLAVAIGYAVAAGAYRDALFYLNVQQMPNGGLRILSDFDGIYNQKAVDPDVLQQAQQRADTEAGKYLVGLKNFLNRRLDQFPLYASSDRVLANRQGMPDNSIYKGVFRIHP